MVGLRGIMGFSMKMDENGGVGGKLMSGFWGRDTFWGIIHNSSGHGLERR